MAALHGLTILVPESRELDLFAGMLEAEGARTLRCPLVQILDLEDGTEARAWIDRFIDNPPADLILLTGEGLRRLLTLGENCKDDFIATLARTRLITRGPKPVRALREIGLLPTLAATVPTSQGVLDAMEGNLGGRRIGIQLYPGDGSAPLVNALRRRGAEISAVTPYRYASQTETARVAETIRALAAGDIGMIAFTASPQIERLFAVARESGLEKALADGLARTAIAAIGPVVEETLKAHGLTGAIQPLSSFHLKPLVRAIVQAWSKRCA